MSSQTKNYSYRQFLVQRWLSEQGLILESIKVSFGFLAFLLKSRTQEVFTVEVRDLNGLIYKGQVTVGSRWVTDLTKISVKWDNKLAPEKGLPLPCPSYEGNPWVAKFYESQWLRLWVPLGLGLLIAWQKHHLGK